MTIGKKSLAKMSLILISLFLSSLLIYYILTQLEEAKASPAHEWLSKLLATFDDDTNEDTTNEILDSGNNKPDFSGELTKFSVKLDGTPYNSKNLDAGDGIQCEHCESSGCTDTYNLGSVTGTQLNDDLVYWLNVTDSVMLNRIEHDGVDSEYLHCWEVGTIGAGEELILDLYVILEYESYPQFQNPAVNDTEVFENEPVNHTVTITDSPDFYIFSWNGTDGCTDGWVNSSLIDILGTPTTYEGWNVSTPTTGCAGKTIAWKFYANNTAGWNVSGEQYYNVYKYGYLEVDWHTNSEINSTTCTQSSPCSWVNNTIRTANATVTCVGGSGAKCGVVSAGARYNETTASPDTLINTTEGATPLYLTGVSRNESMLPEWENVTDFGTSTEQVRGLTVDSNDNIIATGWDYGGVVDGGTTLYRWRWMIYDKDGNQVWENVTEYTVGYTDMAYKPAVDSQGKIYVCGYTNGGLTDTRTIIKYDPSNNYQEIWKNETTTGSIFGCVVDETDDSVYGIGVNGGWWLTKWDSSGNTLWENQTYTGGEGGEAFRVVVDSQQNVIGAGFSDDDAGGYNQFRMVKWDSSGNEICNNATDFTSGSNDIARAVAVDSEDNIIVVGSCYLDGATDTSWCIIKYNSTCQEIWSNFTDYDADEGEIPYGVWTDSQDNVIVAGYVDNTDHEWRIVKYDKDGNELWYNVTDATTGSDSAWDVIVDSEDCIIAGGKDSGEDWAIRKWCLATAGAENPTSLGTLNQGESAQVNFTINMTDNSTLPKALDINFTSSYDPDVAENDTDDAVYGVVAVVDTDPPTFSNNNTNTTSIYKGEPILIYANWSDNSNLNYSWLSTNETGAWKNYTDGTYDSPIDINLTIGETWSNFTWQNTTFVGTVAWKIYANDSAGNENVTGEMTFEVLPPYLEVNWTSGSQINDTSCTEGSPCEFNQYTLFTANATVTCKGGDCGTVSGGIRYNSSGSIMNLINTTKDGTPLYVVWDELLWQNLTTYKGAFSGIAVDSEDNFIVVGGDNETVGGNWQWRIMKFHFNGSLLWMNQTNPSGDTDYAEAVATDLEDNIIVVGYDESKGSANRQWRVVKFNSTGSVLWENTTDWTASGDERPMGVTTDSDNNITIVGWDTTNGDQWRIQKFNSTGSEMWNIAFDNSTGEDRAYAVTIDNEDNIAIAGYDDELGNHRWHIKKYYPNGTEIWTNVTNPSDYNDVARGVDIDSNDNIIVVGNERVTASDHDIRIMKFNSSGFELWTNITDVNNGYDVAFGAAIDADNNIIVVGYTGDATDQKPIIIKYNSSGSELWRNITNPTSGIDLFEGVDTDYGNNIIATGRDDSIYRGRIMKFDSIGNPTYLSILNQDQSKQVNFVINGTSIGSYKIDVNFTSNETSISDNDTDDAIVKIVSVVDTEEPTYSSNSTNSTVAGTPVSHNLYWQDNVGLSGFIFSFDNCTGTLVNDSWVAFSSNPDWSNVTKTINSTVGCTIRWCVYANDTSDNWNGTSCVNPFSYETTTAAQQYYPNISQTLSVSEVSLRTFGGIKAILQPSTLSTILERLSSLFKTLSQSVSLDDIPSKIHTVLRALLQSLTITDIITRLQNTFRVLSQDIDVIDALARLRSVFKPLTQSLGIDAIVSRLYNTFRRITQVVNVADVLSTLRSVSQRITQSLSIDTVLARLRSGFRTLTQALTISDITSKLRGVPRTLSQPLDITGIVSRLYGTSRKIVQMLSLTDVTSRLFNSFKTLTQTLDITDYLTFSTLKQRLSTLSIEITDALSRVLSSFKVSYQILALTDVTTRIRKVPKILTQAIDIKDMITTISGVSRALAQALDVTDLVTRLRNVPRALTQVLSIDTIASRFYSGFRTITQLFSITNVLSRIRGVPRVVSQAIDVADITGRLYGSFKVLTQAISITDVVSRLTSSFRTLVQSLTITDLLSYSTVVAKEKTLSLALSVADAITRSLSSFRAMTQSLNIIDAITRLRNVPRTITQNIDLSDAPVRLYGSLRALIQSIDVTDITSSLYNGFRTLSQTINVNLLLSYIHTGIANKIATDYSNLNVNYQPVAIDVVFGGFRTEALSINITDLIDRILSGLRAISQFINITEILEKIRGILKSLIQLISITDIVEGIKPIIEKILSLILQITDALTKLRGIPKTLTQAINVTSILSRAYGSLRALIQTIKVTDVLTKLRSVFKTLTQAIDVTDVLARLFSSFRETTQTVVITDILIRLRKIPRALTQALDITDTISRFYSSLRAVTQLIQITDVVSRLRSVPRIISQTLGITDVLTRLYSGIREVTQTIALTDIVSRLREVSKTIIQTVNIKDILTRVFDAFREIPQTIAVTDLLSRLRGIPRALIQAVSIDTILSRFYGSFRVLIQSIQITDLVSRLKSIPRVISQSLNIVDVVDRLQSSFRALAQAIKITDILTKLRSIPRALVQSLKITDLLSRLLSSFRAISQALKISDILSKIYGSVREISQAVNITDVVSRLYGSIRALIQSMNIPDVLSRTLSSLRKATQIIDITDVVARLKSVPRALTQIVNIDTIVSRLYNGFRTLTQNILITDIVSKVRGVSRAISQTLNVTDLVARLYGAVRALTQAVNIDTTISRLISSFRTLTQAVKITDALSYIYTKVGESFLSLVLSVSDILTRTFSSFREIPQAIALTDVISGIRGVPRAIAQGLNITDFVSRLYSSFKVLTQTLNVKDILSRVYSSLREATQAIDVTVLVERVYGAFRPLTQALDIDTVVSRLYQGFRTITQTINVTTVLSKLRSVSKALVQILSIDTILSRIYGGTGFLAQTIDVTSIISRIRTIPRALTQTLNIDTILTRLYSGFRAITQQIQVSFVLSRLRTVPRALVQALSIDTILSRTYSSFRALTQALNITTITTRLVSSFRTLIQSIEITDALSYVYTKVGKISLSLVLSITDALSKALDSFRTLPQSLTLTDIVSRVREIPKALIQALKITDAVERLSNFMRKLTQVLDVTVIISRVYSGFRTLVQALKITDVLSYIHSVPGYAILSLKITITDAVTRTLGSLRSVTQALNITSIVSRLATLSKTLTQALNITDAVSYVRKAIEGFLSLFARLIYKVGELGTLYAQVLDSAHKPVNNADCSVTIYYPDKTVWVDNEDLVYLSGSLGLYYYNKTLPNIVGSYPIRVNCTSPTVYASDIFYVASWAVDLSDIKTKTELIEDIKDMTDKIPGLKSGLEYLSTTLQNLGVDQMNSFLYAFVLMILIIISVLGLIIVFIWKMKKKSGESETESELEEGYL
ncbi:MAG: hypothetical protein ACE5KD_00955 [Candidatus Bathyarchaeia archaeon]